MNNTQTTSTAKVSRDGSGKVTVDGFTIGFVRSRAIATSKAYAADYWEYRKHGQQRGWAGACDTRREAVAALLDASAPLVADIAAARA